MIVHEHLIEHYEKRAGGEGTMRIERVIPSDFLNDHVKMCAKVSIDVGSSLGFHQHTEDREAYYIIQGMALYNDNGVETTIGVGTSTICLENQSHGIKNIGEEELIFMAIILKD